MTKRIEIHISESDWAFIQKMAKEQDQTPMQWMKDLFYSKLWEEREINDENGNDNTFH